MRTKQELIEAINKANEELQEIERKENAELAAGFKPGYYKYHNSYSCPQNESDYWWLYAKTIRVNEDGDTIAFKFEKTKYGYIDIKPEDYFHRINGFIEITKDEFETAWLVMIADIMRVQNGAD